jgi:hypothetical protein
MPSEEYTNMYSSHSVHVEWDELTPEYLHKRFLEFAEEAKEYEDDAHMKADCLMLAVLDEHGYKEAADVFRKMDKWYA